MSRKPQIVVVEDELIVARSMQQMLERAGFDVTAIARSAEEALEAAAAHAPDLALVDIRLEGTTDGVALAQDLRLRYRVPSVFVTAHADDQTLARLKAAEPLGFVSKPFDERQLVGAVEVALHGAAKLAGLPGGEGRLPALERALSRVALALAEAGLGFETAASRAAGAAQLPVSGLSPRETEVLKLLLANKRVPSIARLLGVSQHTVRNHLKSIFRKAGVHSQSELLDQVARPV